MSNDECGDHVGAAEDEEGHAHLGLKLEEIIKKIWDFQEGQQYTWSIPAPFSACGASMASMNPQPLWRTALSTKAKEIEGD